MTQDEQHAMTQDEKHAMCEEYDDYKYFKTVEEIPNSWLLEYYESCINGTSGGSPEALEKAHNELKRRKLI